MREKTNLSFMDFKVPFDKVQRSIIKGNLLEEVQILRL